MNDMTPNSGAPKPLNRLEVMRALRVSIMSGVVSTIAGTLVGGVVQTSFVLWLGGSNMLLGLLMAIPSFAGLMQMISSYWADKWVSRRKFVLVFAWLSTILWIPLAFVPLFLPHSMRLTAFFSIFLLINIAGTVTAPVATSWLSDLIPASHRGRYFGYRNMLFGLVGTILALPVASFLDMVKKQGFLPPHIAYAALFLSASIVSGIALLILRLMAEPPREQAPPTDTPVAEKKGAAAMLEYYRAPFVDKNFRKFLQFQAVLLLGQVFAGPFYMAYEIKVLKLDFIVIQLIGTLLMACNLAGMPVWGYLSDRYGNRAVAGICLGATVVNTMLWAFAIAGMPSVSIPVLIVAEAIGGFSWSGVAIAQTNMLIGQSPADKRTIYISTFSAVCGVIGGIAPLLGGFFMQQLSWVNWKIGWYTVTNYQLIFVVAGLFRLWALVVVRRIPEEGREASQLLGDLSNKPIASMKAIRGFRKSKDVVKRRQAIGELAEVRSALASDELQQALDDPDAEVRQSAAGVLGAIGDEKAIESLAQKLMEEGSGVGEQAAEALGKIRSVRAVPPLIVALNHPLRSVRKTAVTSLGIIGDTSAIKPLLELGASTHDPSIVYEIAIALGRIGGRETIEPLVMLSSHEDAEVRIAAIDALRGIGDASCLDAIVERLKVEQVSSVIGSLAWCAGSVKAQSALPALLDCLDRVDDGVPLKQVVTGIGSILGIEKRLYRVMTMENFERDGQVSKLFESIEKRLRIRKTPHIELAMDSLDRYTEGNYAEAIQAITGLSHNLGYQDQTLEHLNARSQERPMRMAEFLLGITRLHWILTTD